jgi:hypothetical protein
MEIIGEYVDRLITVEMRPRNAPIRGMVRQLYDQAREKLGVRSLTLLAAQKILEKVNQGDNVFISTGVGNIPFLPHGETDGPLGAACLGRAINLGLGAKPLFVVGNLDMDSVKFSAKAAGLNIESYDIVKQARNTGAMISFPYDDEEANKAAKALIDEYKPKALFSFETLGPNIKGVHHTSFGFDVTKHLPKLYHLFDEASRQGILTIAGLDCGNEIGSGLIEEEVRKVAPYGNVCQCSCKSGNACRVKTDVAIPVSTSNWAAYGIAAMLGLLLREPDILQDADTERRMLEACVMAGAVDGVTFRPIMVVDGMSDKTHQSLVTMLHQLVTNGLMEGELKRVKDRV